MQEIKNGTKVKVVIDDGYLDNSIMNGLLGRDGIPHPTVGDIGVVVVEAYHAGNIHRVEFKDFPNPTSATNSWPFDTNELEIIE